MYRVALAVLLLLTACSTIPSTGPLRHQLEDQAGDPAHRQFGLVTIDDRVVNTLASQPAPPFHARFKKYEPPPELPMAVGDVVSVTIWESADSGLYGRSLNATVPEPAELADKLRAAGVKVPSGTLSPNAEAAIFRELAKTAHGQLLLQSLQPAGRAGARIPNQVVGPDGGITIPYGGRIHVAGETPSAVQNAIVLALAGKAIDPQVLVVVKQSDANSVTVAGELIKGARVTLSSGGMRLLAVIGAAGGAKAPVRDTYVELSRKGVTASIPFERLVADPSENIFAEPGDILTLVHRTKVITVFGATGKNTAVTFNADRMFLNEVLAKGGGLNDAQADPRAVYLLRYENGPIARALGEPDPGNRPVPVAYRLDLSDLASYHLAQRFPVRDEDIVYVADAEVTPLEKVLNVFSTITAPVTSAYILCTSGEVQC
ncbi:MAG TPA: polysaccharide biosynthesis/export family protein [Stellaceae bacterium]|jgi:polysaccharide export outer membrane protein